MRLPYAQVAMEILEVSAAEMSVELGMSEAEAGWGLVNLIPWALARCPDHEPPSENDVVIGPNAAKLICRAVGFPGDPEAYVDAGERLRYPIFERLACGIRIRGLDRYDAAWASNHRALWAEWQSFRAGTGSRPGSPCIHTVKTVEKLCPDADADADADKPPPPRKTRIAKPVALSVVVGDQPPKAQEADPTEGQKLWAWMGEARSTLGIPVELEQPDKLLDWILTRKREGRTEREVSDAYALFLRDEAFSAKGWPTSVFLSPKIWPQRMRGPTPPKEMRL